MNCSHCGNNQATGSFCTNCGAKLAPNIKPASQQTDIVLQKSTNNTSPHKQANKTIRDMNADEQELVKSLLGSSVNYYMRAFERLDRGEKFFSFWAFFFGFFILPYRRQFEYFKKMYIYIMIVSIVWSSTMSLIYPIGDDYPIYVNIISFLLNIASIVLIFMVGRNFIGIYKSYIEDLINSGKVSTGDINSIKNYTPSIKYPLLITLAVFVLTLLLTALLTFLMIIIHG